ncbi:MAG: hypothetical protein ABI220_00070 [Candidatus Saccharimonadales bacterium]
MEFTPRFTPLESLPGDKDDKEKKSKQKNKKTFVAGLFEAPKDEPKNRASAGELKSIDRALSDLLIEKRSKKRASEESIEDLVDGSAKPIDGPSIVKPAEERVELTAEEWNLSRSNIELKTVIQPEKYELKEGEIYGGEFVLKRGDSGVDATELEREHEILIRDNQFSSSKSIESIPESLSGNEANPLVELANDDERSVGLPGDFERDASEPAEESTVERLAPAGGGDVPPVVPPEDPRSAESSPEPERRPTPTNASAIESSTTETTDRGLYADSPEASLSGLSNVTVNEHLANTPFATERSPNEVQKAIEDAEYYAEKRGQNRGVLSGLLVGGWYEHRKHKKREKRQAKQLKNQASRLEVVETDQNVLRQQLEREKAVNRGLESAQQRSALERSVATDRTNQSMEFRPVDTPNRERERREGRDWSENRSSTERFTATETKRPSQAEKLKDYPEGVVDRVSEDEPVKLPEGRRVENSAWHRIEVDSKTGKVVDKPTLEYGEEYYHERRQETAPVDSNTKSAAGEVALVAAALNDNKSNRPDNDQSSTLTPTSLSTTGQEPGPASTTRKAVQAVQQTTGSLWPYVLALVVVIIAIILVTR